MTMIDTTNMIIKESYHFPTTKKNVSDPKIVQTQDKISSFLPGKKSWFLH